RTATTRTEKPNTATVNHQLGPKCQASTGTGHAPRHRLSYNFLYWFKAARLRRAARAGGHGPPPLPVSATAAPAPGHSARSTAKADSQARKQLDQPEHKVHDQDQAESDQA
ncbi:hypothetical protein ABZ519_41625, partial [Streptomyces collinus]|uniref:hypothetical protein n=1 Tax=Streptomyces collinus TaxID=42684 RepID=UPI0033F1C9CC